MKIAAHKTKYTGKHGENPSPIHFLLLKKETIIHGNTALLTVMVFTP